VVVETKVRETDTHKVERNQKVTVRVEAYPLLPLDRHQPGGDIFERRQPTGERVQPAREASRPVKVDPHCGHGGAERRCARRHRPA
jgi:hypothetical protein